MLRAATANDGQASARIYNHYIENTSITFEETPVSAEEMARRIENVQAANLPWLVLETPEGVVGYAYATKWRERSAYRYSAESTVYLHKSEAGKGYGRRLYEELLAILRNSGIHIVIGGIALPNEAKQVDITSLTSGDATRNVRTARQRFAALSHSTGR